MIKIRLNKRDGCITAMYKDHAVAVLGHAIETTDHKWRITEGPFTSKVLFEIDELHYHIMLKLFGKKVEFFEEIT